MSKHESAPKLQAGQLGPHLLLRHLLPLFNAQLDAEVVGDVIDNDAIMLQLRRRTLATSCFDHSSTDTKGKLESWYLFGHLESMPLKNTMSSLHLLLKTEAFQIFDSGIEGLVFGLR